MKAIAAFFLSLLTLSGADAFPRGGSGTTVSGGLVATLTISGTNYVFDSGGVSATNIGNYVDPGPLLGSGGASRFTEQRIMVTNAALPHWRVYFDQDIAGTQGFQDVVVEYADVNGVSTTQSDAPAYTFVLSQGTTTLYAADGVSNPQIPQQIWLTRWRIACLGSVTSCGASAGWNVASVNHRPLTVTVAQLQTAKLIPTFSGTNLTAKATGATTYTYTPMTTGGMGPNFGITGGSDWIGFYTEQTGYYLVTGTTTGGGLASMFAGAEGMGSAQIWYRDTTTNALIDCHANPQASSINQLAPSPLVYRAAFGAPGNSKIPPSTGVGLNYDIGHTPNIAYVPFLLTGDPYYLEVLQAQAVGDLMQIAWNVRYEQGGRYFSWPIRNERLAIVATPPSSTPSWLLTQSQLIANLSDFFATFNTNTVTSPNDVWTNFGMYEAAAVAPDEWVLAPWQNDFITGTFAEMQLVAGSGLLSTAATTALQQWGTAAQYLITNWVNPRISGTTPGYFRSSPTFYDSQIAPAVNLATTVNVGDATLTVQNDVQCATTRLNPPYIGTWTALFPSTGTFPVWIGSAPTGSNWTVSTSGGSNTWSMVTPATANKSWTGSSPYPTCGPRIVYGQGAQTWADFYSIQSVYWALAPGNNTSLTFNNQWWAYEGFLMYATCVAQQAGLTGADCSTWLRPQIESFNTTQAIDWSSMVAP